VLLSLIMAPPCFFFVSSRLATGQEERDKPDYHVERNAPRGHGSTWGWLANLARLSPVLSRRLLAQEIEQQRDDLPRLLLLHPVPGAVEQLGS
jgi:hypothetical protein